MADSIDEILKRLDRLFTVMEKVAERLDIPVEESEEPEQPGAEVHSGVDTSFSPDSVQDFRPATYRAPDVKQPPSIKSSFAKVKDSKIKASKISDVVEPNVYFGANDTPIADSVDADQADVNVADAGKPKFTEQINPEDDSLSYRGLKEDLLSEQRLRNAIVGDSYVTVKMLIDRVVDMLDETRLMELVRRSLV